MVMQVALLRALALVVAELEEVPDDALAACLAVARRLAGVYAGLYAGQRTATHAAMAALLHALAPRPALLAAAAPQLVATVLEATLRQADAAGTSCATASSWSARGVSMLCVAVVPLCFGAGLLLVAFCSVPLWLVLLRGQGAL